MTTLAQGASVTCTPRDGGTISIATNGGFGSVVVTPVGGSPSTTNFGPAPIRQVFGPYAEGASIVIANQSCNSLDYDAGAGGFDPSNVAITGGSIASRALLNDFQSVKAYGAVGDGVTDDTAAIQTAVNATPNLYWPPGIYAISTPIAVPDFATWIGPAKKQYPNFTTDWQIASPSWGAKAATLQYVAGGHGALISGANFADIRGMVFRSGQARTTADCFMAAGFAPSHLRLTDCLLQNLNHVANQTSASWGAWFVTGCQFIGCASLFSGVIVDMIFRGNAVTSTAGAAITLGSGAGFNLIAGNRFEYGTNAAIVLNANSRQNVIEGNNFDAHGECGVVLSQCSAGNIIRGNIFWRNGTTAASLQSQCHIYIFNAAQQVIEGNTFIAGAPDAGGATTPLYVVGLESAPNTLNRFVGNQTRNGCTSSQVVKDRFGTSVRSLVADVIGLPAGASAGVVGDDLYNAVTEINNACAAPVRVALFENRLAIGFGVFPNVQIEGIGSAITITNSSGAIGFGTINNISYGGLAYTTQSGMQYATAQPDASRANGRWMPGRYIYNSAPSAGGTMGWVCTTAGSPDTWKTFGSIAA